jgi:DNA (cytosine-5)-methyltransferase 1
MCGCPRSKRKETLLRTPAATEGERGHQPASKAKARGGQQTLSGQFMDLFPTVVEQTTWGKFEPAIRLWETILDAPAPEPTKPDGKDKNPRLSSKFTEWMMGLPEGWITDVGLTRNEELKLAGNGVVPQQAELALRLLLNINEE